MSDLFDKMVQPEVPQTEEKQPEVPQTEEKQVSGFNLEHEDLKGIDANKLEKFKGKSVENILKSYFELEKNSGGAIKRPEKLETAEDIAKFGKNVWGLKDDLVSLEVDSPNKKELEKKTSDLGIHPKQANELLKYHQELSKQRREEANADKVKAYDAQLRERFSEDVITNAVNKVCKDFNMNLAQYREQMATEATNPIVMELMVGYANAKQNEASELSGTANTGTTERGMSLNQLKVKEQELVRRTQADPYNKELQSELLSVSGKIIELEK